MRRVLRLASGGDETDVIIDNCHECPYYVGVTTVGSFLAVCGLNVVFENNSLITFINCPDDGVSDRCPLEDV